MYMIRGQMLELRLNQVLQEIASKPELISEELRISTELPANLGTMI
jgi:hypothetical protein